MACVQQNATKFVGKGSDMRTRLSRSSLRNGCTLRTSSSSKKVQRQRALSRVVRVHAGGDEEGGLLDKLNPFKAFKKAQQIQALERQRKEENQVLDKSMAEQIFGTGLMGKMATSVLNATLGKLRDTMEEAQAGVMDCYDDAVREVQMDQRVQDRLGGSVQCTPPLSQGSSSQTINGVSSTRTTLMFIAQGGNGRQAQVQATSTNGSGGGDFDDGLEVSVAFDDGTVWQVDGTRSGAAGSIIDIDADGVIDVLALPPGGD